MALAHRTALGLALLACAVAFPASARAALGGALAARAYSVTVSGVVPKPYRLTPDLVAKLPRASVRVTLEKGGMATYEGVALSDVLARAGVRFGKALHGGGIAQYLQVDAADRYRVVFALA